LLIKRIIFILQNVTGSLYILERQPNDLGVFDT